MTDTNNHENIIIRYMNFLVGDTGRKDEDDAFRVRNSGTGAKSNFIFDHCGFFWGKDETFAIEANNSETGSVEKVTVQNSIIGESFNNKGMIIWRQGFEISFIDVLFSNNHERNIRSSTRYASWEQINCVIYNYYIGVNPTWSNEFDVIGNVFLRKGSSISDINIESTSGILNDTKAYLKDNTNNGRTATTNISGIPLKDSRQVSSGYTPIPNIGTTVLDNVLNDVGANLNGNNPIAEKQINDVINGTGSWISSESQTVALTLKGGTPYTDTDKDGMSDEWEIINGLNPNDASDGKKDTNGDGYTNLETFLHFLTLKN
ncbi:MAG: thrombospondin type 3 repeat-containing protein [Flavobacteriaceae bacterium]